MIHYVLEIALLLFQTMSRARRIRLGFERRIHPEVLDDALDTLDALEHALRGEPYR